MNVMCRIEDYQEKQMRKTIILCELFVIKDVNTNRGKYVVRMHQRKNQEEGNRRD